MLETKLNLDLKEIDMQTLATLAFWLALILLWCTGGFYAYTQSGVWKPEPKPTAADQVKYWRRRTTAKLIGYSLCGWALWLRRDVMIGIGRDWMLDDARRHARRARTAITIIEHEGAVTHTILATGKSFIPDDFESSAVEEAPAPAPTIPHVTRERRINTPAKSAAKSTATRTKSKTNNKKKK